MPFAQVEDPAEFVLRVGSLLSRDPVRNSIPLGVLSTMQNDPGRYESFCLWIVDASAGAVAAALRTPPFPAVVVQPRGDAALVELAEGMHGAGVELPGVNGAQPEAGRFAELWAGLTGTTATVHMSLRLHALEQVEIVPDTAGQMRYATALDRGLLGEWMLAFMEEARLDRELPFIERMIRARLAEDPPGLVFWEMDGRPVSFAGFTRVSVEAARVGPVYTPPHERNHGYATALVAAVTRRLLEAGHRRCTLTTDLANPTSNSIYRRIGYLPVCDSADYRFDPPALS
jgi:predicted GNAT family acetyltransferase